jgi:hypothetical protein
VHEVLGAVHRVDGEPVLGGVEPFEERRVVGVGLLAEHDGVGVGRGQRRRQQLLGLVIGDRDQVAGVLLRDLVVLECPEPRRDHLFGDLLHEPQHGVGVHAATLSP